MTDGAAAVSSLVWTPNATILTVPAKTDVTKTVAKKRKRVDSSPKSAAEPDIDSGNAIKSKKPRSSGNDESKKRKPKETGGVVTAAEAKKATKAQKEEKSRPADKKRAINRPVEKKSSTSPATIMTPSNVSVDTTVTGSPSFAAYSMFPQPPPPAVQLNPIQNSSSSSHPSDKPRSLMEQEQMNKYFVDFNDPQDPVKDPRLVYRGYPFVCNLTSGVILQKLFSAIKHMVPKAPLTFSPKGIFLSTFDKSNAALISIMLRASDIENYYCPNTFTMSFNMDTFANNFADLEQPTQTLTLKCNSSDWLDFEIDSPDTGGVYRYREQAIAEDLQPEEVPKLMAPFRVKFPVEVIHKAATTLGNHSPNDKITFVASNKSFKFKVDEHKEQVYYRTPDNEMQFENDNDNDQRQLELSFGLSYLKRFVSIMCKIKQPVTLSMQADTALYVKQDLGVLGYIRYVIANAANDEV